MPADTIYALSSGGLPSGVAVIRVSGPHTRSALEQICDEIPPARQAALKSIRNRNGSVLDQGLVLYFPAPASFTGEDCAELQVHGGRAVVDAILSELSSLPGLKHAEAGEFSRRAFHNGKLDLVEIEGLADLITAETEMQRRLAQEHSSGKLSALYQGWARRLTHARAMIEAELDFADEDDVPGSVAARIWADMRVLKDEIADHLSGVGVAEIIRDGLKIVIAGEPNAGKSSLLNYLAKRDVAIVTDVAGTTRDVLSVDLSLAGFSVRLFDTAGLRQTEDIVEKEGIRRAYVTLAEADIVLLLADTPVGFMQLTSSEEGKPVLRVGTKVDRDPVLWDKADADVLISTITGAGMDRLIAVLTSYLPDVSGKSAMSLPSRKRHVSCLQQAHSALEMSFAQFDSGLDIQAEFLRQASDALGRITGRVDVEDLLDVIFSEFCIGK
ncbi:tRNA uridine-5-carboxymethylaminomethyl(34) synthesis GTPase MnmE [Pararhizobium sp. BT-229]|uniref:tRNA uridine-5-carboxymethylaminomethyl(34) synthesis GTPase MnmE n=1 Tax=Pararhizobium sp. BT-229 TaxID=2986923 RepID=UPI0021F757F4|nr:tRNA uridine-5-carboxymethylaminomethyl(34) synthesis GTPase MnmE [Pararhizobium sp. BT-229]MCV9967364.1 tRNA uridine-5-carboxymethylaminomethyl(34) synthesis GTPase MnmE [Pararhizobium sp. BT-229]